MSNRRGSRRNERRTTTVITYDLIREQKFGLLGIRGASDSILGVTEKLLVLQAMYRQYVPFPCDILPYGTTLCPCRYTKLGFAGNTEPQFIIPSGRL